MGMTLTNTVGYGLRIPYTNDHEYDLEVPPEWQALRGGYDEDEDEWARDVYDTVAFLLRPYKGLAFDTSYYHDHMGDTVVFVDVLSESAWDTETVRVPDLPEDMFKWNVLLFEVAQKIGMDALETAKNLGIWSVVSYG